MNEAERRHSGDRYYAVTLASSPDGMDLEVTFDDERSVAYAGLILPATMAAHLGLEATANRLVSLSGPGYFQPGRKAMTLVHSMIAGGDCIDDTDVLRAGGTAAPGRVSRRFGDVGSGAIERQRGSGSVDQTRSSAKHARPGSTPTPSSPSRRSRPGANEPRGDPQRLTTGACTRAGVGLGGAGRCCVERRLCYRVCSGGAFTPSSHIVKPILR